MRILFLIFLGLSNLFALPEVSYSNGSFTGNINLIPSSTALGIVVGVIGTVTVFKVVRNLLIGSTTSRR